MNIAELPSVRWLKEGRNLPNQYNVPNGMLT